MAAATEDRKTTWDRGEVISYPVAASTTIYNGTLVCIDADGYAVPAADTAGFLGFAGVALEQVDNSAGSDGDLSVQVRRKGIFRFACAGMAITNYGADLNAVDDQTVGLDATTTNDIKVGRLAKFVSATEVDVDVEAAF